MRTLWIFLNRYSAFFLFIIFFGFGLYFTIVHNVYQRSVTYNSTNEVVGKAYEKLNLWKRYFNLGRVNDSLSRENAILKNKIQAFIAIDSAKNTTFIDTVANLQYSYIAARVIKNSITLRNNIITINKGSLDGIENDMAVVSPVHGVVGFIRDVSPHLSTVQSLLHKDTKISVALKKNNAFGSLVWGEGNFDIKYAYIKQIPNHIKINLGDSVITNNSSRFPGGIPVGIVVKTGVSTGDNFLSAQVKLFNDFGTLDYVYVIKNNLKKEQEALETGGKVD